MSRAKSHSAAASTVLSLAILSAPLGLVVLNSDAIMPRATDGHWVHPDLTTSGLVVHRQRDSSQTSKAEQQARSWLLDRQQAAMATSLAQGGPEGLVTKPLEASSTAAWPYPTLTF